ncbi:PEGA domain-containing protein [Methanofollis fontis]|uniref:PEGA domain-containing protein n=1 Tax=Methanofollis fontis TaxID=2052832 RepID=A0A483CPD3_9EURY|nr:PEGA domain-containing protein [Methanofollis fontis]TAJ44555.1 hypothetical protein CUJ86_04375 [Methanofollis fontis]
MYLRFIWAVLLVLLVCGAAPVSAATTSLTITKLASDDTTVLNETTVTWTWMRDNLPVYGDGITVYYNQGPVFEGAWDDVHPDEPYDPWNPTEDVNIEYKDHGEFRGTNVLDLCALAGGTSGGDMVTIRATDGMSKTWPAEYVIDPDPGQGPMVIGWDHGKDLGTVEEGFTQGMRLYFLAQTTNAAGQHVWGNWDMHEAWSEDYWYYYNGEYPSASGNSVYYVSDIVIHSQIDPSSGDGGGDGDGGSQGGFMGSSLNQDLHGSVNGSIYVIRTEGPACRIGSGESCTFYLDLTGLNRTDDGYFYLFGTNNTDARGEEETGIGLLLGTQPVTPSAYYADAGDTSAAPVSETWRYDLDGTISGTNLSVIVTNRGSPGSAVTMYGGVLVAPSGGGENRTAWWIAEGADTVQADPDQGVFEDDATTTATFAQITGMDATALGGFVAVTTGASGNDTRSNRVTLNSGEWINLLTAGPDEISIGRVDVTPYLHTGKNTVSISSIPYSEQGDYLENRLVILTVTETPLPQTTPSMPTTMAAESFEPTEAATAAPTGEAPSITPIKSGPAEKGGGIWDGFFRLIGLENGISDLPLIGPLLGGGDEEENNGSAISAPVDSHPAAEATIMPPSGTAPANATITVITHPEGAQVFLDGEYSGRITPLHLEEVPTGHHTLALHLADYESYETSFELEEDTTVAVTLDPLNPNLDEDAFSLNLAAMQGPDRRSGGIFVEATDEGAEIYIDGKKIDGTTPQVVNGLKEGLHRVKIKMGSTTYSPSTLEVWVTAGAITPVFFNRFERGASRTITIDDPGYSGEYISVNGVYTGKKVPAKVTINGINAFAGIFLEETYLSVPISDFAEDGSTTTLEDGIETVQSIRIGSDPPGARIFVDGFDTGIATPGVIERISPGYHRIMLSKPGFYPEDTVFLLPERTDEREITLILEPYAHGSLYVNSTPQGARIYLYGLNTGEVTPHLFCGMALGAYDVKVVGRSDSQTTEDVLVRPNEVTVCECRLEE